MAGLVDLARLAGFEGIVEHDAAEESLVADDHYPHGVIPRPLTALIPERARSVLLCPILASRTIAGRSQHGVRELMRFWVFLRRGQLQSAQSFDRQGQS